MGKTKADNLARLVELGVIAIATDYDQLSAAALEELVKFAENSKKELQEAEAQSKSTIEDLNSNIDKIKSDFDLANQKSAEDQDKISKLEERINADAETIKKLEEKLENTEEDLLAANSKDAEELTETVASSRHDEIAEKFPDVIKNKIGEEIVKRRRAEQTANDLKQNVISIVGQLNEVVK